MVNINNNWYMHAIKCSFIRAFLLNSLHREEADEEVIFQENLDGRRAMKAKIQNLV